MARRRGGRARPVARRARSRSSAGPRRGRTGTERARGEARYTADLQLPGDAARGGAALAARARARERARPRAARSSCPACAASSARATATCSQTSRAFQGAPVAAVAADTLRPGARRARARSRSSGRSSSRCSTRRRPSRQKSLVDEPRSYERGDVERGLRRGRRRRRGRVPHADRPAQLDGDAPVGLRAGRATRSTSTSRRSSSGASATPSPRRLGLPADKVRVVCEYMGGGFGSKNGPGDYTFIAAELAEADRPARCAARSRAARRTSPPATATRRSSSCAAGARSDGTLVALDGEFVERDRLVGLVAADRRADARCSTPARTSAR